MNKAVYEASTILSDYLNGGYYRQHPEYKKQIPLFILCKNTDPEAIELLKKMLAAIDVDMDAHCKIIQDEAALKKQLEELSSKAILDMWDEVDSNGCISELKIPCVKTVSPAAILTNPALKRPAWEDLKQLKQLLESQGIRG